MSRHKIVLAAAVAAALLATQAANAALVITEVQPQGSGDTVYAADWFELTNTGSVAINFTGFKVDDNSNSAAAAVAFRGISSILPGQSVVFLEGNASGSTDATLGNNFKTAWWGSAANAPSNLALGFYGGSGIGLSTGGDAVNIFNGSSLVASVLFGAAPAKTPGGAAPTFDNTAGLNNATLAMYSQVGVNGAFLSFDGLEIGSPGVTPVPLPAAAWLLLSGCGALVGLARRRRPVSAVNAVSAA